ncbi:hypothetical protein [Piscinibacter koreensis]|uniref:Glycine zipper family protein n=1 Tax=Piscinibacter koreensis TaxID=2742824 RepID=A0A7Y6TV36_9BURK|nr:hypothetical protein [Schlegelella koreensis]NUZ04502.1 hypothetical protein [Schlegelella koreensis]
MRRLLKASLCAAAVASMALSATPAEAQRHGRHVHHGHGRSAFVGGVGIGIGLGGWYGDGFGWPYGGPGWAPGYTVVPGPLVIEERARRPVRPSPPEPVVEPRRGQSPAETEGDRRACNRWAATQPAALADAREFHRMSLDCLQGRGYTVR